MIVLQVFSGGAQKTQETSLRELLRKTKEGFLPKCYNTAHDLCFVVHDILAQFLVSGEQSGVFTGRIKFENPSEAASLEAHGDIFEWLDSAGRVKDRARVLKTLVLPAVLSDMLHCIYEALESSRKAKLNVSYILLRKPIQESLFLLESIVIDELDFANKLATNPLTLRAKLAGGLEAHTKRIQLVLDAIGEADRFDATYLAQLRYSKTEDGFDGICNKAIHLFTEHEAIRTESLNINFIFSDQEAKLSQWAYLYTRLPYVLVYTLRVVDHIGKGLVQTYPEYLDDISRRVAALVMLWKHELPSGYGADPIDKFIEETRCWLLNHCAALQHGIPTKRDLGRMATSGALPGESVTDVEARHTAFELLAALNRTDVKTE